MKTVTLAALLTLLALAGTGCFRGRPFEKPPIHINPNMDNSPKYKAQMGNEFYADGSSMRQPPAGTVARGGLHAYAAGPLDVPYRDEPLTGDAIVAYYTGAKMLDNPNRADPGNFVQRGPLPYSQELLDRGQERYTIYCAVCHGAAGDGNGIVRNRETGRNYAVQPLSLHARPELPDGKLYDIIANGTGAVMPAYGPQISVADRWAIVAYVRALQLSQHAAAGDLPAEEIESLRAQSGGK